MNDQQYHRRYTQEEIDGSRKAAKQRDRGEKYRLTKDKFLMFDGIELF